MNPEQAVRAYEDLGARRFLAMHWGTFKLTDEPLDEPPRKLDEALAASGLSRDDFWVFRHGETRTLGSAAWPRQAATAAAAAADAPR
jgi:L-ascorbate metabolism protein UlaG (beta-lactamase superfamily)